jgi:hypothetical protein
MLIQLGMHCHLWHRPRRLVQQHRSRCSWQVILMIVRLLLLIWLRACHETVLNVAIPATSSNCKG